jgi:hypothetical protein
MPARDLYHNAVKNALIKEGWTIIRDPYTLEFGATDVFVDFSADRIIAAERGVEKIAIEVKTFGGMSPVEDFRNALGQYALYLALIEQSEPERHLYLAVPNEVFLTTLEESAARTVLKRWGVSIVTFDPQTEEIVQWKTWNATDK